MSYDPIDMFRSIIDDLFYVLVGYVGMRCHIINGAHQIVCLTYVNTASDHCHCHVPVRSRAGPARSPTPHQWHTLVYRLQSTVRDRVTV